MQFEKVDKLIYESNKLMDYTMSMKSVTKYEGQGNFDSGNYSRLLQEAKEEVRDTNQMDKKDRVINKIVNAYFEKPEKTLKEVFEEYTEDLTKEEIERFFNNLKTIIN